MVLHVLVTQSFTASSLHDHPKFIICKAKASADAVKLTQQWNISLHEHSGPQSQKASVLLCMHHSPTLCACSRLFKIDDTKGS